MRIDTKTRLDERVFICFCFLGRGEAEKRAMGRILVGMAIYGTFAILEV